MSTIKLPWDFGKPTNDPSKNANVPTPEGAEVGRELARLADVEAERHPEVAPRCDDCAFRLGTPPNQSLLTLADAVKCVVEGEEPFYCHKGMARGEEPKALCRGYVLLSLSGALAERAQALPRSFKNVKITVYPPPEERPRLPPLDPPMAMLEMPHRSRR